MTDDGVHYPERLYHYTNLASLALILQNRTLRLMPLTGVDDPQENQTNDVNNLGRFFFASCWTDEAKESIPMWNMYASLESGVRISLPPMPFKRYEYTTAEQSKILGISPDHIDSKSYVMKTFMPLEDFRDGRLSLAFLEGKNVLQKVVYTDDPSKLRPDVVVTDDTHVALKLEFVGKCKNTYWEFQHEWRYLISIIPFDVLGSTLRDPVAEFSNMVIKMICGGLPSACSFYDLHLADTAFKDMIIVPSPKMSAGNRALLSCLLERYGLTENLESSQLDGLL